MQLLQRGEEEAAVSQQMSERNVAEKKTSAAEASSESGDTAAGSPATRDEIEVGANTKYNTHD